MNQILPQDFYLNDTVWVAKNLLGKTLVRIYRGQRRAGIIVETEAYLGTKDPACHTFANRKSKRNQSMYLPGGHGYVYFIYGMYYCFNVVTQLSEPEAVLIRAIEPTEGISQMLKERKTSINNLTCGPGKLCMALKIDRKLDGLPLTSAPLFIEESQTVQKFNIGTSARIGINHKNEAAHWPLRFYILENPYVSKK